MGYSNENPFRIPWKPEQPPVEKSAAELKARYELLKMLGDQDWRSIESFLEKSPYAETLKKDKTVVEHAAAAILKFTDFIREDWSHFFIAISWFPGVVYVKELKDYAYDEALYQRSWSGSSSQIASELEREFHLTSDPVYLAEAERRTEETDARRRRNGE